MNLKSLSSKAKGIFILLVVAATTATFTSCSKGSSAPKPTKTVKPKPPLTDSEKMVAHAWKIDTIMYDQQDGTATDTIVPLSAADQSVVYTFNPAGKPVGTFTKSTSTGSSDGTWKLFFNASLLEFIYPSETDSAGLSNVTANSMTLTFPFIFSANNHNYGGFTYILGTK
jgi:hypothetical protein